MVHQHRYHSALIIDGQPEGLLEDFSRIVAATLDDYGHPVERKICTSDRIAHISASHYAITLTVMQGMTQGEGGTRGILFNTLAHLGSSQSTLPERQWRVQIELSPTDHGRDDPEISELLLVVMLYRMTDAHDVRMVEWLDPLTLLTTRQFLKAFAGLSPSPVPDHQPLPPKGAARFAPIDDTAPSIAAQVETRETSRPDPFMFGAGRAFLASTDPAAEPDDDETEERPSDIRRLATWGLTGMLMFLSAPVAASMAAVNLIRGEDFRLNTHVLAFTVLLVTLQSSGLLSSLVAILPI